MQERIYSTDNEDKQNHKAIDHCHYTGKLEGLLIVFLTEDTKHQKEFL